MHSEETGKKEAPKEAEVADLGLVWWALTKDKVQDEDKRVSSDDCDEGEGQSTGEYCSD